MSRNNILGAKVRFNIGKPPLFASGDGWVLEAVMRTMIRMEYGDNATAVMYNVTCLGDTDDKFIIAQIEQEESHEPNERLDLRNPRTRLSVALFRAMHDHGWACELRVYTVDNDSIVFLGMPDGKTWTRHMGWTYTYLKQATGRALEDDISSVIADIEALGLPDARIQPD